MDIKPSSEKESTTHILKPGKGFIKRHRKRIGKIKQKCDIR